MARDPAGRKQAGEAGFGFPRSSEGGEVMRCLKMVTNRDVTAGELAQLYTEIVGELGDKYPGKKVSVVRIELTFQLEVE